MVDRPGLLTPKQVARAIGVSEASVKRWCDRGLIETTRTAGGHRRLHADSVVSFLKESGYTIVQPDVLGLPSTSGHTARIVNRGRELFAEALKAGQQDVAWQTIADLQQAGHTLTSIVDDVIAATFSELAGWSGDESEAVYRVRRANEICLRITHNLCGDLPAPRVTAPLAFSAALDGEQHNVTVALAELVLREVGWNAISLGIQLPFQTLKKAIRERAPRLLCLQIPRIRNEERIRREFVSLHRVAANRRTRIVVVGGDLNSADLRSRLRVDEFCETFTELGRVAKKYKRQQ